jgi:O-antigen/teichoic acid export membrane protein
MSDVLVSHRQRIDKIVPLAQRFFWQACGVSSCILLGGAIVSSQWLPTSDYPAYVTALLVLGMKPWLESLMAVRLAVMRSDLRFRSLSIIDGVANSLGTVLGIVMALSGCGAISLVVPVIIALVVRTVGFRAEVPWVATDLRRSRRLNQPLKRALMRANAAQYVHNIVFVSDALILGFASTTAELGVFSFAFLVASQANAMIGFQLGSVLQPIFVRLRGDQVREGLAYCRVIRCVGSVMVPISVVQAAIAPVVFESFFPTRWSASLIPFMALSLAQGFYFAVHPTMAFLKSRRKFGALLVWQLTHGVVAIFLLWPLALGGGASAVAIGSSVLWAISVGTVGMLSLPAGCGARRRLLTALVLPWLQAVPIGLAALWCTNHAWAAMPGWGGTSLAAASGLTALVLMLALSRWTNPGAWADIMLLASQVRHRFRFDFMKQRLA